MQLVRNLPKASEEYDFFCAFVSLLEILNVRGYNVARYKDYINLDRSIKDRFEWFQDDAKIAEKAAKDAAKKYSAKSSQVVTVTELSIPYKEVYKLTSSARQTSNKYPHILTVYILDHKRDALKIGADYVNLCKDKNWDGCINILAVFNKPKDLKVDIGMNVIEIMCFQQLFMNPLLHERAPLDIVKLDNDDKEVLMNRDVMVGKRLVTIMKNDPVCMRLNASPGDVIRYIDAKLYTGQLLSTVEYKMVGV